MHPSQASSSVRGIGPTYKIAVYHPDTRSVLSLPLQVLLDRIRNALKVDAEPRWLPTLVAMADGLFMQQESIVTHVGRVAGMGNLDVRSCARQVPEILASLLDSKIAEKFSVEELYRKDRLAELNHPRVWELNSWWEKLYGAIPTRSHLDWDEDEDLDIWEEGPMGLCVGKMALPLGIEPERDDVRQLLEKKTLSQHEPLYRLRLSWHR